jgi:tetratricopeptide (TPR) repeat protein
MRCEAPIPFQPGAGSRLCPFCGAVNLVREQLIAAPQIELKIDEVFRLYQNGQLQAALELAESLLQTTTDSFRLAFYRGCILGALGRREDAIYALIDLTGMEGPGHLRADAQAELAGALLAADRVEEAIQATDRCLELQDGHPRGCLLRAQALSRHDQGEPALKLIDETLARMDRSFRVTFPVRRCDALLLRAEIEQQLERHDDAAATLEDLILTDTAAPLPALRRAARMLGRNYLEHAVSSTAALELLRLSAMLDPENRHGMLDDLRAAAQRAGADFRQELDAFKQARDDLLGEIRAALTRDSREQSLKPELITADLDLTLLAPAPDARTDRLEQAAERMQLGRFDRGTLYPLRTIEDFRRWLVGWRLRERVAVLRRNKADIHRILKLKEVRGQTDSTGRPPLPQPTGRPRRRWLIWLLSLLGGGLVLAGLFIALVGDRFLDHFEGQLIKVDCIGEQGQPPCTLHVAAGAAGRRRYQAREQATGLSDQLWHGWVDARVQADGTILYPLSLPWGELDADDYRTCVGKPIAKMRFTLAPICNPDQPQAAAEH